MSLLHSNQTVRSNRNLFRPTGAAKRVSRFAKRHTSWSTAGGLVSISVLVLAGAALNGGFGNANTHKSSLPAAGSVAQQAALNDTTGLSADPLTQQSAAPQTSSGTGTNISVTTTTSSTADGTTSQVSVDGQPVTTAPQQGGSTVHTVTSPDGQQTTVMSSSSNNQVGDTSNHRSTSLNNVSVFSNSSSHNFQDVHD